MNKKLLFIIISLGIFGLSSFQLNAQNSDFEGTVDALWTNTSNWLGGVIAVDRATIKADVDLETGPRTVKEMRFIGAGPYTVSNGTFIVGDAGSNNTINNGTLGTVGIFDTDCVFTVNVDGKRFRNNGTIIFNGTLEVGGNVNTFLDLAGGDHYELNGTVTGTNLLKIQGSVILGASSDLTGYTGDYEVSNSNSLVSNTTNVFINASKSLSLDGTGTLTVNGANTVEGDILRLASTAGAAEVTFNANQNSMNNLSVDTQTLALNFDPAVTEVVFSGIGTMTGVVDLKNYTSGVLQIGNTATTVSQTILDTWLLDGNEPADGTITQDTNGDILVSLCVTPTDVTTLVATETGAAQIDLSWVSPTCFEEILVVAKEASAVTVMPTGDGSLYIADATFGSGTDLGTGEYAVFKGGTEAVTVSGLNSLTTYHFTVFTRTGTSWNSGVTTTATTNNTFTSITAANNANLSWEDTSSWIGGTVPSAASDDVTINAGLIINSDVELNDMVNNARVTVNAGFFLDVQDLTCTASNILVILKATSNSFASLIVNTLSSSTSSLIYDRIIANTPINDLVSSPVGNMDFSSLAVNSQNENRLYINPSDANEYLVGPFDNTDGTYGTFSVGIDDAYVFDSGKGYRMATNVGNIGQIRFQGEFPMGAIGIALTDESGTNATTGKWNLIGNPHPSYIDFETFFTANKAQFDTGDYQAVYGYAGRDGNDDPIWTIWNQITIDDLAVTEKIAPGQAFFVASKPGGSTTDVSFTPAMRTAGIDDDFMLGRSAASVNLALAEITMSKGNAVYNTDIYFVDNQTRGLDPGYDAGAYLGSANGIYTNLVDDNQGVELAIQALPYNDFNDVVVPLGVKSDAGVQLTIGLNTTATTIPSDVNVYLEDNVTNTWTLLNTGNYVFTPTVALNTTGRFFLHFTAQALSINDDVLNGLTIFADQSSKTVVVKGQLASNTTAVIYDMQGRLVVQQDLEQANTTHTINVNALHTGVYIVQLGNASQSRTQKVIIK